QCLLVLAIELLAVTVSLADCGLPIDYVRQGPRLDFARPGAQPQGAPKFLDSAQFAQLIDDPVWSRRSKFARVGFRQPAHIPRVFDAGSLHPQADTEIWDLL